MVDEKTIFGEIGSFDVDRVREFLLRDPSSLHIKFWYDGRTPLIHAVMNAMEWAETSKGSAQIPIIKLLLDSGADKDAKTNDGRNALDWAAGFAVGSSQIIRNKDEAGRIIREITMPMIKEMFEGVVNLLLDDCADKKTKVMERLEDAKALELSVIPQDPTPPVNGRFALPLKEGIFVDVDGTLIVDGKLNTELYEKLRIAEELGYTVTVISGGYMPMQNQRLKELGVDLKCLDKGVEPKSSYEHVAILEFLIDDTHPGKQKLHARCYEKPEDAFESDYKMAVRVRKRAEEVKKIIPNPLAGDGITSDAKKLTSRPVPEKPEPPRTPTTLKTKG